MSSSTSMARRRERPSAATLEAPWRLSGSARRSMK
jgi:hypothetical protein